MGEVFWGMGWFLREEGFGCDWYVIDLKSLEISFRDCNIFISDLLKVFGKRCKSMCQTSRLEETKTSSPIAEVAS